MKKILVTAAILILGAMLGVGCYLAYQHFQSKESDTIKTLATVKEKEPETKSKHRLDMELAVTDAEKEFFAMMNNYFDAIDKAVDDKQQGRKTDFKEINLPNENLSKFVPSRASNLVAQLGSTSPHPTRTDRNISQVHQTSETLPLSSRKLAGCFRFSDDPRSLP